MSETRMGVIPDDEPVSGTGVEQPDVNADSSAGQQADKTFTQAEVDAILSKRLSETSEKFTQQLTDWQRQSQERDAAITALSRELEARRSQEQQADPYAHLTPGERELARVNGAAVEPLRREFNAALGQVANLLAPTLARDSVDDFFESGRVPTAAKSNPDLKARTLFWLKRGAAQGMQVDGAYRLALSEVAEKMLSGGGVAATPTQTATQAAPRRTMPEVVLGNGRRSIVNQPQDNLDYTGIDNHDPARNLKAWFKQAAQLSEEAPMDGAMADKNGTRGYSNTKPPI